MIIEMNPGEPELGARSCKHAVALLLRLRMGLAACLGIPTRAARSGCGVP